MGGTHMVEPEKDFYINQGCEMCTNTLRTREFTTHGDITIADGSGDLHVIRDGSFLLVVEVGYKDHDLVARQVASAACDIHTGYRYDQSATRTRTTFDPSAPSGVARSIDGEIPF